ncbi:MAG: DUF2892 domain-containing protein [Betaproteobacteria bacterium]|nr:DUF2892 domain-containing protein [Betaproteobacteria bacterium]
MNVNKNLGQTDRICRGGLGLLAAYAGLFETQLFGDPLLAILVAVFGLMNVVSAAIGWCVVYQLAGLNTCKASSG